MEASNLEASGGDGPTTRVAWRHAAVPHLTMRRMLLRGAGGCSIRLGLGVEEGVVAKVLRQGGERGR
jgi:hypothetical protein